MIVGNALVYKTIGQILAQQAVRHPNCEAVTDAAHRFTYAQWEALTDQAAKALLDRNSHPTREEIHAAMSGNLCRCTGYTKIEEAVVAASRVIDQYANGKGAQQ